jgi:hypothetical protein
MNWKRSLLLIAAAVATTAATASAQDVTLRATVPFGFSVNRDTNLPAGDYSVSHQGNAWWFRSESSSKAAAIGNAIRREDPANQSASLTFSCVRGRCYIQAIHFGNGWLGVEVPTPRLSKSDAEELALVSVPLEPNR